MSAPKVGQIPGLCCCVLFLKTWPAMPMHKEIEVRILTPREAAIEERLAALRKDDDARAALETRVSEIQRSRAQKLKWTPIEPDSQPVPTKAASPKAWSLTSIDVPSLAIPSPGRNRSKSPGKSTARSFASDWSADASLIEIDPVGGWREYRVVQTSQVRGKQTLSNSQPPLKYGFESDAERLSYERRVAVAPLATSAKVEPLLYSQRKKTGPEVELVHSPLPGTLRPPLRFGERAVSWRPATRQTLWTSAPIAPSLDRPTSSIGARTKPAADEELALARAAERAKKRPPSAADQRQGPLQKSAKEHASRVRNGRAAERLADARPLSAAQLKTMPAVVCRFGRPDNHLVTSSGRPQAVWRNDAGRPASTFEFPGRGRNALGLGAYDRGETLHRVGLRDFDEDGGLSEEERRAERAILSTRLGAARRGAKRFL